MEHSKLADALENARQAADRYGANILHTSDISRQNRELLCHHNWLQEIIKGWYMLTRPDLAIGDSTAWYTNFWDFLRVYLNSRYDSEYCVSAEASLELQIGSTLAPEQVIVIVSKGGNVLDLPFGTSLMTYPDAKNIPAEVDEIQGLRVMSLPMALCRVTPTYYREKADNIVIALRSLRSTDDICRVILQNNYVRAAERILGAYQALDMVTQAETMHETLLRAGMKVTPTNPFEKKVIPAMSQLKNSPFVARLDVIWQKHRDQIIEIFPSEPGLPKDQQQYLRNIDDIYQYDAYNSLSIEGYQVSPELIDRVKKKEWNPDQHKNDANARNALAAKGYFEAFQSVKKSITKIFNEKNPGEQIRRDLPIWFQQLFSGSVDAGIISAADLIGYRRDRVFIRNSRHAPPGKEVVLDAMDALFSLLENERSAAVRAVLGHYVFVFIHPFMDGNGRIARFILNAMLASGGYNWTVIQVANRKEYIDSLESVHTQGDIESFTKLIIREMQSSSEKSRG